MKLLPRVDAGVCSIYFINFRLNLAKSRTDLTLILTMYYRNNRSSLGCVADLQGAGFITDWEVER